MADKYHACINCNNHFAGKFCNRCGEKVFHENDKSFMHIFEEAFHFLTHFEGKFFNTLRAIITSPGKLSFDYCNGIRKKYFKPISFFLMLVILYLLFPIFEGLNMKLVYHQDHFIYSKYAYSKSMEVAAAKNLTPEQLSEIFHSKGEKASKFLLFVIIPILALYSWLVTFKKRKYYFDHFIFSTEVNSFFLFWGFLLFPMLVLLLLKLDLYAIRSEALLANIIMGGLFIYLFIASRRFFKFKWWQALLYSIAFLLVLAIVYEVIYKFLLFFFTIRMV
jgi:hypothetical protein